MIVQKSNMITASRIRKGMAGRSLAKKAGLSNTTVSLAEKNIPVLPSTAKKICMALEMEFDDLFQIVED